MQQIETIIERLENYKQQISQVDYIHEKRVFLKLMSEFRQYIASIDDKFYDIFHHSKYFEGYKTFFTEVHEYYLRSLESMQALSVMTQ